MSAPSAPAAGAGLRRWARHRDPGKIFAQTRVSSLPEPWSGLIATWLDAFGFEEEDLHVATRPAGRGIALFLHDAVFLLDYFEPGMLRELQLLASHLERLDEAFRRHDMIRLSGRDGLPPAWSFLTPALAPSAFAQRGISVDEFLTVLACRPRAVRTSLKRRRRRNPTVPGLGMNARIEGERLWLDIDLGGDVWFTDLSLGRLDLPAALPETTMTALVGRSALNAVHHPALVGVAGRIRKVQARWGRTLIDFDMPVRLLADPPARYLGWPGTAAPDRDRTIPPWRSDGAVRRLLFKHARTLLAAGDAGQAQG